ncbi:hypothetical protein MANES_17G027350v8 [Manihot esculenta]|uniref:Uncharacterized protein n=1 Tax=Manihot esculenta TaxID=3983 RepID=A0ACB7G2N7_MANES|nr:hypothetical protein MANES_17G027350v8 [Manihot esculenta]
MLCMKVILLDFNDWYMGHSVVLQCMGLGLGVILLNATRKLGALVLRLLPQLRRINNTIDCMLIINQESIQSPSLPQFLCRRFLFPGSSKLCLKGSELLLYFRQSHSFITHHRRSCSHLESFRSSAFNTTLILIVRMEFVAEN